MNFRNSDEDPDGTDRIVNVTFTDDEDNSATAVTTIHVIPVNDVPIANNVSIGIG
jgi:hypothetical protein